MNHNKSLRNQISDASTVTEAQQLFDNRDSTHKYRSRKTEKRLIQALIARKEHDRLGM